MLTLLRELDQILRGQRTRLEDLRDGTVPFPLGGILVLLFLLGVVYGFCMGWFSWFNRVAAPVAEGAEVAEVAASPGANDAYMQMLASMGKVPMLFLLTLIVTFPSLYVFNALVGSKLRATALFRLLIAALAVTMAVLASFGPIVAFFSVTSESYSFIILFNVVIFAIAGILGCLFLMQTLHRLSVATGMEQAGKPVVIEDASQPAPPTRIPGAIDRLDGHVLKAHVKNVVKLWIVVYGVVGAQMAWILRPFIGNPDEPFTWFRPRQSSFFESVWHHFMNLFT
jgi:hypothetical protein